MKKIKLLGVGNQSNNRIIRYYFILQKGPFLKNFLAHLLFQCGFKDNQYLLEYQLTNKDVSRFCDAQSNYFNSHYDIDFIYGLEALIILVRVKNKTKMKIILDSIEEFSEI